MIFKLNVYYNTETSIDSNHIEDWMNFDFMDKTIKIELKKIVDSIKDL